MSMKPQVSDHADPIVVYLSLSGVTVPLAYPPAEDFDALWLVVLIRALSPPMRVDLRSERRGLDPEDTVRLHEDALVDIISNLSASGLQSALVRVGCLAPGWTATGSRVMELWEKYACWVSDVGTTLGSESWESPRSFQLAAVLGEFRKAGVFPPQVDLSLASKAVNRRLRSRKSCDSEQAPDLVTEGDVWHKALWSPGCIELPRDTVEVRLFTRTLADRFRDQRERPELTADGLDCHDDRSKSACESASDREVQDRVAAILEGFKSRGPEYRAACDYLLQEGHRQELAEKYGVSVKRIRSAEREIATALKSLEADGL